MSHDSCLHRKKPCPLWTAIYSRPSPQSVTANSAGRYRRPSGGSAPCGSGSEIAVPLLVIAAEIEALVEVLILRFGAELKKLIQLPARPERQTGRKRRTQPAEHPLTGIDYALVPSPTDPFSPAVLSSTSVRTTVLLWADLIKPAYIRCPCGRSGLSRGMWESSICRVCLVPGRGQHFLQSSLPPARGYRIPAGPGGPCASLHPSVPEREAPSPPMTINTMLPPSTIPTIATTTPKRERATAQFARLLCLSAGFLRQLFVSSYSFSVLPYSFSLFHPAGQARGFPAEASEGAPCPSARLCTICVYRRYPADPARRGRPRSGVKSQRRSPLRRARPRALAEDAVYQVTKLRRDLIVRLRPSAV